MLNKKFKEKWLSFIHSVQKVACFVYKVSKDYIMPMIYKGTCNTFRFCKKYLIPIIYKITCFARESCKNSYFTIRYYCFHILASIECPWLPFIRQAEQELKPHNKHLRPQYTWVERLSIGLLFPILMFILPSLAILVLSSFRINLPLLAIEKSGLAGYLKTMATVMAAFTGLLLTVIALTVRVKTSNFTGAAFLLNAIIRKSGFLPAAVFMAGIILASLVGMMFSEIFSIGHLNNYTWLTALFCFISFCVLVDLLRRTMQTLGINQLEQLLREELFARLRKSFRDTLGQVLIQKHFSKKLANLGFGRGREKGYPTEYRLKNFGKILAIDPLPLRKISYTLKLNPLPLEDNIPTTLGFCRTDHAEALLTVQEHGKVTKQTQLTLLTKEQIPNEQIAKLIQKTFIIKKHYHDSHIPWQRLREMISSSIVKFESSTIIAIGNAINDIFEDYLDTQTVVAGKGKLLLEDFTGDMIYGFKPPRPSELRFSGLITHAGRNHSQDCLDELLNCIYKLAQTSFQRRNQKYYKDWIFEFCWAHHSFGPYTKETCFNIASDITRRIHWLGNSFRTELNDNDSAEKIQEITPYAIIYLSLCLRMLKFSAEKCDESTFNSVLEHVEKFFEHEMENTKHAICVLKQNTNAQMNSLPEDMKSEIAYNELLDYKNLVYVIAGAWLTYKVKNNNLELEKTDTFLEKLIAKAPNFRDLLDLYAMPGMADMTTNHDNLLGYDDWDWGHSYYSEAKFGTDFGNWISPFYQFLLLKKSTEPNGVYGTKLQNVPQTKHASHESLIKYLTNITEENYNLPSEYHSFLDTDKLSTAKERIGRILNS